ncbi:MAG: GGDEF domain-containing protein [bacterium]|nr:GGDEF domain-containing protein [bacterium]
MFQLIKRKRKDLAERVKKLEGHIYDLETNLIHDPLTGLKARAFFEEEVSTFLQIISQQSEAPTGVSERKERFGFRNLSIIFFDIDHFKKVNDQYGHDVGDKVLIKVAQAIQSCLRTGDTVARWGGEEVLASLLGANEQDASAKAEEIREMVEKLVFPEAPELKITISAGVTASEKGLDLNSLIKRADQALYNAKNSGRNKVVSYSNAGDTK